MVLKVKDYVHGAGLLGDCGGRNEVVEGCETSRDGGRARDLK
jgi:hypothetical protein